MTAEQRNVLYTNGVLWIVAMILHPLANLLPSASGEPPKILSLLIPLFFLLLGAASTMVIRKAFLGEGGRR